MATRNQDFEIWAGNDKWMTFIVEDMDNLDGYEARWAVSKYENSSAIFTKEVPVQDMSGNSFTVKLDPEDTKELSPGTYYHEAKVDNRDSDHEQRGVFTVATGNLIVHNSIFD